MDAGDYAPVGTVGASETEAALHVAPLELPRLAGKLLPLTVPARIYVCGITPYDVTHLGHASTFVWADVLGRVLKTIGVPTEAARNVTDVDDVLTAAAAREGADYASFGLVQEHRFDQDMRALAVRAPTSRPRARHHIDHVIRLASTLLTLGSAYERGGTVYFRGADVPAAAGLTAEDARTRLADFGDEPDDPRRDTPFDVPIWRVSDTSHPAWPSPWGPGRPGWHAECSAMALATLGGTVDVVVGGEDLAFPHHAYQSAIAQAVTGGPFGRAAMHVGTVRYQGSKMAKSTGNLVLAAPLVREAGGAVLRTLLLDRPWARSWEFDAAAVEKARERLDMLYRAAGAPHHDADATGAVKAALLDDLDVPTAISRATESGGDAARFLVRTLALD